VILITDDSCSCEIQSFRGQQIADHAKVLSRPAGKSLFSQSRAKALLTYTAADTVISLFSILRRKKSKTRAQQRNLTIAHRLSSASAPLAQRLRCPVFQKVQKGRRPCSCKLLSRKGRVERHFFEGQFGGFYLFLFQTPHDSERVATFARRNESAPFHRLEGIAIGRQRAYFFIVFQPPQDWVAAERISFKLVSVLDVRK
jgi:hypothetical protein